MTIGLYFKEMNLDLFLLLPCFTDYVLFILQCHKKVAF